MKISKSTAILTGLSATALILVLSGKDTEAAQHHHKSIWGHVHTHMHAHHFDGEALNRASHDQWAFQKMMKEHQKLEGAGQRTEKDISRHMHKPIPGNAY